MEIIATFIPKDMTTKKTTIVAMPTAGWNFKNWTENDVIISTDAVTEIQVSTNRNIVANFEEIKYTVTLTANPPTGGEVKGGGII